MNQKNISNCDQELIVLNQYNLKLLAILFITFNGIFLSSLIAVGQLIADRKSSKTWLFFLLFLIVCLFQIHYIIFEIQSLAQYKIINLFPVTAIYLLGPVILGITKLSVKEGYTTLDKKEIKHLVPVLAASLVCLVIIFNTEYSQFTFLNGYYYNRYVSFFGILGTLIFALYLFGAGGVLFNSDVLSTRVILKNPPVFVTFSILILFAIVLFTDILAASFNSRLFMEISLILLNSIIIFLFLIVFKYPDYYKTIHIVVKEEKQKRQLLKGIDLDLIEREITDLIEKEQIFMDENLSLDSMAAMLGLGKHQLSQYMNDILGENFASFINRHRIKAAKKMLIQRPDENIIIIAYEVGFKSKSTFNASFAKFEKTTPKAFRKSLNIKS